MKLLTKEIIAKLPKFRSAGKDPLVVVKFFYPAGAATWYITEGEKEEDGDWMLYGLCDLYGNGGELGYVMLSELENTVVRGLHIERDLYWKPVPLSQVMK